MGQQSLECCIPAAMNGYLHGEQLVRLYLRQQPEAHIRQRLGWKGMNAGFIDLAGHLEHPIRWPARHRPGI